MSGCEVVNRGKNAQHDQNAGDGQRSETGLTAGELSHDLAPLAQHVEQRADETAEREGSIPLPFRAELRDSDSREYKRDAEPAEKSRTRFNIRPLKKLTAPTLGVHRLGCQEQTESDEAQVVDDVLGVEDALGEIVEVIRDRQERQNGPRRLPDESASQLITQSMRKTAKVMKPATI